jgi:enoyl-CoA hydratase
MLRERREYDCHDPGAALMTPHRAVLIEPVAAHIVQVVINRPEARNAVNGDVTQALARAVEHSERDPDVWVTILTGSGDGVFCAGADLKEISAGLGDSLSTPANGFAGFVFARRRKPWIAAVNGLALAGGCELALACDMIVAAEDGAFALPEVKRGLVAGAGGMFRLPRAIPHHIALELIATGDRLSARRAYELGLVNRLAPAADVRAAALKLAGEIAVNAPIAVRESLAVARRAHGLDDESLRNLTLEAWELIAHSEDFKEGPRAFIEKRAPQWSGK